MIRVKQKREVSVWRGAFLGIGIIVSHLGTTALLCGFSYIAALIYFLSVPFCLLMENEIKGLGKYDRFKEL